MLSATGFSQSISLTDLIVIYDAPHREINTFLTKEKKYKVFKQATAPQFTVYHYFLNSGEAVEEEVITGMGFEIEPGKISTDLYYKSKDSSFVANLQKQVSNLGLKFQREHTTKEVKSFEYSNKRLTVNFSYATSKNYMILFSRKRPVF